MAKELGIIIADFQTSLAGKIAIGGVSGSLLSATDDDGVILPDGRYFFTIDSDNSSKEHISCDLVGTTKEITNIKTVARGTGVETVGTLREHRIGATVTITDFAHIKKINDLLDGTTDLDADNPLKYDADPTITDDKHLATKKYIDDVAIAGAANASSTVKGISKLSEDPVDPANPIAIGDNDSRVPTQDEKDALAGTSGTPSATNTFITNDDTTGTGSVARLSKIETQFGGDGSDGALSISSGVTTINLGGAAFYEKNYTSISITGTGSLAFSNPHANGTVISLKSQGNVVITTSTNPAIDLRSIGGSGGGGGAAVTNADGKDGGNGPTPLINYSFLAIANVAAGKGNKGMSYGNATGGTGATITTYFSKKSNNFVNLIKNLLLTGACGGGGGGGASGRSAGSSMVSGAGGAGGKGAGSLIIECGLALDFSSTINASGINGTNGGNAAGTGNVGGGGGAGGGGAGGFVAIIYRTLTSNTGTITVTGGNGGNGGNALQSGEGNGGGGSGGGGGASIIYNGGDGGVGGEDLANPSTNGTTPAGTGSGTGGIKGSGDNGTYGVSSSWGSGGGGGGGASGFSLVASL